VSAAATQTDDAAGGLTAGPPTAPAKPGSLLALRGLAPGAVRELLGSMRRHDGSPAERAAPPTGKTVANLFFEDSTRTRVSFSIAARRLGAEPIDLDTLSSSRKKGESLVDTALTIEAMGAGALVVRSAEPGGPAMIDRAVSVPVVSAGDGRHEHPTQGLLDAYTVAEAHGRLEGFDLSGLRVVVAGDLAHSRVARSDAAVFTALGAEVIGVGPPALAPAGLACLGCAITDDLDAALERADAVQMLRVQKERGALIGSLREYARGYRLDGARAARLKPGAIVMHPGPMNRGVEITDEVADGPRSRIRRQVAAGVLARMAVLERALGAAGGGTP